MVAVLTPFPVFTAFDSNGDPLAGGKLYSFEPGTSTPKALYSASDGLTPLSNPVVLDSAGQAEIWLSGQYKLQLDNASDVTQWTIDPVGQIADASELVYTPGGSGAVDTDVETFLNQIPMVTDFGAVGDGATDDRAAFATAEAAGPYMIPAGTYRLATDITLAQACQAFPGAILTPDAGVTVTVGGGVRAGRWQIFDADESSTGAIRFSQGETTFPEWWGAAGDGVQTDTDFLKIAIIATAASKGTVDLAATTYIIDGDLAPTDYTHIRGQGMGKSILKNDGAATGYTMLTNDGGGTITNFIYEDFSLDPNAVAVTNAIAPGRGFYGQIRRIEIVTGFSSHRIQLSGLGAGGSNASHDNVVEGCVINSDDDNIDIMLFRGAYNNKILNNYIYKAGVGPGIIVDDWSSSGESYAPQYNLIQGNHIVGTDDSGGADVGIGGAGSEYTIIANNIIDFSGASSFAGTGIRLLKGATGTNARTPFDTRFAHVTGNTIILPSAGGGVGIQDASLFSVVGQNTVINGSIGLAATWANDEKQGNVWTSNNLYNQDTNGMLIKSANTSIVANNLIHTVGDVGIAIDATDFDVVDLTIIGNTIDDVQNQAITIDETGANVQQLAILSNTIGNVHIASAGSGTGIEALTTAITRVAIENNVFESWTIPSTLVSCGSATAVSSNNHRMGRGPDIITLQDAASPDVHNGDLFVTGGTTTITSFDGVRVGKRFTVIAAHAVTLSDGASLPMAGDFTMAAGDTITFVGTSTGVATEICRSDNT